MGLVKRSQVIAFLNTTPSSTATWSLVGKTMTDGSYTYEATESSETYITDDNATTLVESYKVSLDGEMKCNKGDGVFDFINGLRYNLAVGDAAKTTIMLIDKYDVVDSSYFKAQTFECSISISSYGGPGGEISTIGFKVSLNGDPINGKAVISAQGVPTFTPNASV